MTNELSSTSILSLFETTKEQRRSFVSGVIETIREGVKNPLEIQVQIKCMEEILKEITGNHEYRKMLEEEATKNGKTFEFHNATIHVRNAPGKWDYSKTNDWHLFDMYDKMTALKASISAREKFLQTIPEGGMADPETGALIYRAAAPAAGTVIAVTLK